MLGLSSPVATSAKPLRNPKTISVIANDFT
jgi:hypothetical protein